MKKIFYIVAIILGLAGCERSSDWDPQQITEKFIVVEGNITDEAIPHQVRLSTPVPNLNDEPHPVTGAVVTISDGGNVWTLSEHDTLKGTYVTAGAVSGVPGRTYTLRVELGDTVITASDVMSTVSDFTTLKVAKVGNTGNYQITWVANTYHPNIAAMYEIRLDWSSLPEFSEVDPDSCRATLYYFTLTTIDVSDLFSPAIEKLTFPKGTVITEKKYSLSPAYEEFIRCLLLETSWRGGLWDAIPANLPTNISGNNAGFFSASSVNTATIVAGD